MQNFQNIPETQTLSSSREMLLNNEKTIMSLHSGTVFPTSNIEVGMLCYRTDQGAIYQLTSVGPSVWKLLLRVGNKIPFQHDQTLTSDGNMNNYVTAGSYAIPKTGLSNHPVGTTITDDQVIVVYERDVSVFQMIVTTGGTSAGIWVRAGVGSTKVWTAWTKVWTQANDGASSGLDADLLDGQEGSFYAPINDANLTGNARAPNRASSENSTAIANTAFVQTAVSDKMKKTGDVITGELKYGAVGAYVQKITANSAASSDNYEIGIAGGGDTSVSRGAFAKLYGVNHATKPGVAELYAGTGGYVSIYGPDGTESARVNNDGITTLRGGSSVTSTGYKLANGQDLGTLLGSVPVIRYYTTTGANTWTKPAGLKGVIVEVQGGGGAGGSAAASSLGQGGGAGGYSRKWIDAAALGATETVTVGAAGGTSSFGAHCSATGGAAGTASVGVGGIGLGGAGGSGTGGDLNVVGQRGLVGSSASNSSTQCFTSGAGASSMFGGGGGPRGPESANGIAATSYGAGGGGAVRVSGLAGTQTGGPGFQGIVIVTEFY